MDSVLGSRLTTVLSALSLLLGQLLFSAGAFADSFALMVFSRFVFGIGGELLVVGRSSLAASWFEGKELSLTFGLGVRI